MANEEDPQDLQNSQEGDKKSKVTLGLLIALPIVILSIIFFYNGNIAYGVLMISLPVLSLIVSTCCYMLDKRSDDENDSPEFVYNEDDFTERERPFNPLQDRPPSYRMTWRRSFIKRFKQRREDPTKTVEMITIERSSELNESPNHDAEDSVKIADEDSLVIEKEEEINIENETIINEEAAPSANKPIASQKSLPTYEEAIVIMNSRENIS
ncbi:UNVERIFIED_CONTAM: hypothetical protein RMT77_000825 [Armadillidium vulgare]